MSLSVCAAVLLVLIVCGLIASESVVDVVYYKSRVENVPVYMWIYNKFAARDLAIRKRRSIDYDDDEDDDDEAKEGGIN